MMSVFAKMNDMLMDLAHVYDAVARQRVNIRARVHYQLVLIPTDQATGEIVHGAAATKLFYAGVLGSTWTQAKKSASPDFETKHIALTRARALTAEMLVSIETSHGLSNVAVAYHTRGLAKWDALELELHSSFPGEAPIRISLAFDEKTKTFAHAELTHSPTDQPHVFKELHSIAVGCELHDLHALPVNTILANMRSEERVAAVPAEWRSATLPAV